MQYSREVEEMFCVAKGAKHDPAPIPEEGKWVKAKEITDIFGLTHGVGWSVSRMAYTNHAMHGQMICMFSTCATAISFFPTSRRWRSTV